jgi:leader peptidase (prepilin peptidase) / N-methyltransferase
MINEPSLNPLFTVYLILVLVFCSLPDLRHLKIPNTANLANLLGALAYASISLQGLSVHLLGGFIGFGSFIALSSAFKHLRGYDGLGLGDAKFMAGAGTWVGWQGLPPLIFIASVSALLYIGSCRLRGQRYGRTTRLPFAPSLSTATLMVWLMQISGCAPWLL